MESESEYSLGSRSKLTDKSSSVASSSVIDHLDLNPNPSAMNLTFIREQLDFSMRALLAIQQLIKFIRKKDVKDVLMTIEYEIRQNLEDQLRLIDKPLFEVAVVGKEKACKSTLLNSWLDFNLLPTHKERCTYTTIEIRGCVDASDEKYSIEYFTKKEFLDLFEEKKRLVKSQPNDLMKKEIDEIQSCLTKTDDYLGRKTIEKTYNSLKDVERELHQAITDPAHARAVKKVVITTQKLLKEEKVVFYDNPGWDSPITYHKELTSKMVSEADAILFVKEFDKPSLNEAETEILEKSSTMSKYISIRDKMVVALTRIDETLTRKSYSDLLKSHHKVFEKYHIPENRIIPVCALAAFTEETAEVKAARKRIAELKLDDGVKLLKKTTVDCVNGLRLMIASKRCNSTKRSIEDLWMNVCASIRDEYQIQPDSEIKDHVEKEEMDKKFNEWWVNYWNDLVKSFQKFFVKQICPKSDVDGPTFQSHEDRVFKTEFQEFIRKCFNEMDSLNKERQRAIYIRQMSHQQMVDQTEGNIAIRKEVAREAIEMLDDITMNLNKLLWKKYDEIIDWIRNNMWNMTEIRREMIGVDEQAEKHIMQKCLDALIQRLARPATEIFLRFPRSRNIRKKVLIEYKLEIMILDNFIVNGKISPRGLVHFLANGKHNDFKIDENIEPPEEPEIRQLEAGAAAGNVDDLVDHDTVRVDDEADDDRTGGGEEEEELDEEGNARPKSSRIVARRRDSHRDRISADVGSKMDKQFDDLEYTDPADNFDDIHNEIIQDAHEYFECLMNSIFYGSGLLRFYKQELDEMRSKFIALEEEKRTWTQLVNKHWVEKDPHIPAPTDVMIIQRKSSVLKILKETQEIIKNFKF